MKQVLRQIARDGKEYLRYLKYKNTLPNNPNNSDLYIVEFPKGGITWFSTILANTCFLEEGINKKATYYNLEQFIGDVHINKIINTNESVYPYHRIIKSHDSFNPYYRHVVYLIRNPFSVMNSYYHYTVNNKQFTGTFDEFIKNDKYGIKTWVRHVESWLKPQKEMKFHLVRYEDLQDNAFESIKNLFGNLGYKIDDEKIQKAIDLSQFSEMKKNNNHYKEFSPVRKYDFVREGKKNIELSDDIKKYIILKSESVLKEIYPEYLK